MEPLDRAAGGPGEERRHNGVDGAGRARGEQLTGEGQRYDLMLEITLANRAGVAQKQSLDHIRLSAGQRSEL